MLTGCQEASGILAVGTDLALGHRMFYSAGGKGARACK